MYRVTQTHKGDRISYDDFLAFFTTRGCLREHENFIFSYKPVSEDDMSVCGQVWEEEDAEAL